MKNLIFLFIALFTWACSDSGTGETAYNTDSVEQSTTPNPETTADEPPLEKPKEPILETYRSDQARPGVTSEFMEVKRSADRSEVLGLSYWTDRDPEHTELQLLKTEEYKGEEEGSRGAFRFPGDKKDSRFLIAEGMLDVTHPDGNTQTFELTPE